MADARKPGFGPIAAPGGGVLLVFADDNLRFGPRTRSVLGSATDLVARAAKAEKFTGKSGSALDIVAPAGLKTTRLVVIGTGKADDRKPQDLVKLGGIAMGRIPSAASEAMVVLELGDGPLKADAAADVALGATLRAYSFERYKTKRKEGEEAPAKARITLGVADVASARKAWASRQGVADGVIIARDLVNEPPNILFPVEFARRAAALRKLGVGVDILDVKAMRKLGMGALLGVGQGSRQDSRIVVMRWNGGKKGTPPIAFIGKGVCFDTGGISIKPAAGMEDMKGDMAGAACVVGLMHALAARKAKVNAIGAIGLVENMPDGNAQRPGDIVTSMSGQTIEIINTDAEGRLVLADVCHYVNTKFKPKFMIDLATLTGAIMVALGQEHAGLFSNDDKLSERLTQAGLDTGERVWRMPLAPEYDKMIDSKFADMKNTGGRFGGSITAAQFIQRFVGKTPWAHLDIAGTGFASPSSDINKSWGSGWGVRLLDRLVAEHYEG
ncbi:MAG: leucyl aminopeptidase [Hyphomicrobiales bacterium]|jgi:leucyl aminopeptidase|nr:leucyl aminopeptidase [Hyphomicrobiales bacterium]